MKTNKIDTPQIEPVALLPQDKPVKRRTRAVQSEDVQFIADQVARGLTETHAVDLLGKFNYRKWVHYKEKPSHSRKVADLFSRMKASRMSNLVGQIEVAGTVEGAKLANVRFDWRAAQMLAGLHDDRFRSQQRDTGSTTNQTAIIIGAGGEQAVLKMLDGIFAQRQSLPSPAAVKLIDCPANGQNDGQKQG